MTHRIIISLAVAVAVASLGGQTAADTSFRIEKLDPALDQIIAPDAKLETLGDRFAVTEGSVWVEDGQQGYLLFSDCAANVI